MAIGNHLSMAMTCRRGAVKNVAAGRNGARNSIAEISVPAADGIDWRIAASNKKRLRGNAAFNRKEPSDMATIPHLSLMPTLTTPIRRDRTPIYQGIGRLIWAQYCLENDIVRTPFEQAPDIFRRSILEASEALANMALDPDRRDAALMCMADAIHEGNYERLDQLDRRIALRYLQTAEAGLQAFLMNMLNVPPDVRYREEMCSLVDALAPKTGVQ